MFSAFVWVRRKRVVRSKKATARSEFLLFVSGDSLQGRWYGD